MGGGGGGGEEEGRKGGGGVMILLNSNLGAISVDNVNTPNIFNIIEDIWCTFCFGKDNFLVGVIHRPPNDEKIYPRNIVKTITMTCSSYAIARL